MTIPSSEKEQKEQALAEVLQLVYKPDDIKERIKGNNIETFRQFVKRLKLPPPNTQGMDVEAEKNELLALLSEYLITSNGKRLASGILGLRTFKEMYQRKDKRPDTQAGRQPEPMVHHYMMQQVHQMPQQKLAAQPLTGQQLPAPYFPQYDIQQQMMQPYNPQQAFLMA